MCFIFVAMNKKKNLQRSEQETKILVQATAIYMKYGIKSVTMDEMARQLGISKKTLYMFVSDKNELVEKCVLLAHEGEICQIGIINEKNKNAIDEILEISRFVSGELKKIHPSIFFDLAKYHPDALKIMTNHKQEFVRGCVINNLQKGIEQGLYRENLNVEVLSSIYQAAMDHIILGDIFPTSEVSMEIIYKEYFRYHINGIASAKGLNYLNELIKNDENF